MIVASLVLILVAVTLLVLGLASGSSELLVSSIGASLLAAVALVVGARQAAAARAGTGSYEDDERDSRAGDEDAEQRVFHHRSTARANEPGRRRAATWGTGDSPVAVAEPVQASVPTQGVYRSAADDDDLVDPVDDEAGGLDDEAGGLDDDGDPPDEPAPQYVSAADAARVARMTAAVLVIDGRPRYHLPGCVHLLGREGEPIPVGEAVDLGFTPCGLCEPDSALLADARRV